MLKGMLPLICLSIVMGSVLRWLIFPTCYIICLPSYLKLLTLFVCILGALCGYLISNVSLYFYNKALNNYYLVYFLGRMWFIPSLSTLGIVKYPLDLGILRVKRIDQGWSEYLGGQNLYYFLRNLTKSLQVYQFNNLKIYLISFFLWILLFLLFSFIYLNSLYLELNIEDITEIDFIFKYTIFYYYYKTYL